MFHCDNEAVVNIVNKGRSKMADIMKLMRTLTWLFKLFCSMVDMALDVPLPLGLPL
jgi:hypothetical protein